MSVSLQQRRKRHHGLSESRQWPNSMSVSLHQKTASHTSYELKMVEYYVSVHSAQKPASHTLLVENNRLAAGQRPFNVSGNGITHSL
jgi:hypothetical protein